MSAATFRAQMDSLATEYGLLEEENRQLRAQLSDAGEPTAQLQGSFHSVSSSTAGHRHGSFNSVSSAAVGSQSYIHAANSEVTVPPSPVQLEVELQALCHTLSPEAVHFAGPDRSLPDFCSEDEASPSLDSASVVAHKLSDAESHGPEADLRMLSTKANADTNNINPDFGPERSFGTVDSDFYESQGGNMQKSIAAAEEWKRRPIFANADDMKERVRQQLTKTSYNVMDFYKKRGIAQQIARHQAFETITLLVIGLNALWIWIDTDYNDKDLITEAHPIFQVAEHSFCLYFFVEISLRFCAFKYKSNCLKDWWFIFDFFLVLVMVIETWVMTIVILATNSTSGSANLGDTSVLRIARLLRLMRMARVARLLRAMPELVILIKGMVAAARSVFFTLVLLFILLYVFSIALTQVLRDTSVGDEFFFNVPRSMHTLWLRGTLLDEIVEVMDQVEKINIFATIILDLFILAAALTVMNMLVGVLCEVVSAVAASEREEIALSFVKTKVEQIFNEMGVDADKNGKISKEEFVHIIQNQQAARAIHDLGVDVVGLVDFAEVFFSADTDDELYVKELSFTEFMEAVVALRGSNSATVKDIMDLRKALLTAMAKQEKQVLELRNTTMRQQRVLSSTFSRNSAASLPDLAVEHFSGEPAAKKVSFNSLGTAPYDRQDQLRSVALARPAQRADEDDRIVSPSQDNESSAPASSAKEDLDHRPDLPGSVD